MRWLLVILILVLAGCADSDGSPADDQEPAGVEPDPVEDPGPVENESLPPEPVHEIESHETTLVLECKVSAGLAATTCPHTTGNNYRWDLNIPDDAVMAVVEWRTTYDGGLKAEAVEYRGNAGQLVHVADFEEYERAQITLSGEPNLQVRIEIPDAFGTDPFTIGYVMDAEADVAVSFFYDEAEDTTTGYCILCPNEG